MRSSIPSVFHELKEACRRSLYNGNELGLGDDDMMEQRESSAKRRRQDVTVRWRSWEEVRIIGFAVYN